MKEVRKVRAGQIDTATLNNECRMVAGDVEQRPIPIQFAGDEPRDDEYDDTIDMRIIALAVAVFAIAAFLVIVS